MSDTTDNDEALEERAEKALENVMRLRSERDDLAHRVAELERELRARRAVDGWLADAGIETRSLERHGDWLKVYEWKTANEGTRCFEVAEAETYEVLADALGVGGAVNELADKAQDEAASERISFPDEYDSAQGFVDALMAENTQFHHDLTTANARIAKLELAIASHGIHHCPECGERLTSPDGEEALRNMANEDAAARAEHAENMLTRLRNERDDLLDASESWKAEAETALQENERLKCERDDFEQRLQQSLAVSRLEAEQLAATKREVSRLRKALEAIGVVCGSVNPEAL